MGIFRKSAPEISQCIRDGDAEGLCFFLVSGSDEEKREAADAFLRLAMKDPRHATGGLLTIREGSLHGVAGALIETAGPLHGSILSLACYGSDAFRASLVKYYKKRLENPYEEVLNAVRSKRNPAACGALHVLMAMGRNAIPYVAALLPDLNGDLEHGAACFLKSHGWAPKNPADRPYFFFICKEWDDIADQGSYALPLLRHLAISDDPGIRCRAIQTLGVIGDSGEIATIHRALSDADGNVRSAAVEALGKYPLDSTGSMLRDALDHRDPQVRLNAAWVLHHRGWEPMTEMEHLKYLIARMEWEKVANFGEGAIRECSRLIRGRDPEAEGAVRALTMMGTPGITALEAVTAPLSTPEQISARDTAQETITDLKKRREREEIRQRQHIEELEQRNRELEEKERKAKEGVPGQEEIQKSEIRVLEGFRRLRAKKNAEKKIAAVCEGKEKPEMVPFEYAVLALESNNPAIRASAVDVLAIMGARAHGYIAMASGDESPLVRTAAAEAMGFLGTVAMLKYLLVLLKDSSAEVRTAAVQSLGLLQDARAISAIMGMFGDGDPEVRQAASTTVVLFGEAVYPLLLRTLNDKDPEVKICAVQALGELRFSDGIPVLISHLYEQDGNVRSAVSHTLALHDGRAVGPLTAFAEQAVGDPLDAAVSALYEIDPIYAAPFISLGEQGIPEEMMTSKRGQSEVSGQKTGAGSDGSMRKDKEASGQIYEDGSSTKSNENTVDHRDMATDADSIVDALVRIEQGDQDLSQELLLQMYDEESPFLHNIMDAFMGSDRNQAYFAANLVDTLGWSPQNARETFLYRIAKGEIDAVHEGGEEVVPVVLELVFQLEPDIQRRLIHEIKRIGGEAGSDGLARLLAGPDSTLADAAETALRDMGPSVLHSLRKMESDADVTTSGRIRRIIQEIST
ncbi:hypothetical protein AZH53_01475 [Methanomicrobiaceae archaeon CYW5]|uniref:HEAT repeat domain-containing protein n=1 Tax=Methanovulcanius yangii TaxID=1789227 RepID=UPI0029CA01FE|nr:HEAT repeat domain-containing protein [Methanovulcanius yangii]MBT8507100.1 hypothetical protein [Methanovulcanius yangii]